MKIGKALSKPVNFLLRIFTKCLVPPAASSNSKPVKVVSNAVPVQANCPTHTQTPAASSNNSKSESNAIPVQANRPTHTQTPDASSVKVESNAVPVQANRPTQTQTLAASSNSKSVKVESNAVPVQANRPTQTQTRGCIICMENMYVDKMFIVTSCAHSYCFSCMSKHVRFELRKGKLPKCPHHGCMTQLKVESCSKFLTRELLELMSQRVHEASIPAAERIYCPNPRCSALFSKTELLHICSEDDPRFICCPKCKVFFCMDCKVAWHGSLNCSEYRIGNLEQCNKDDMLLTSLASKNLWRPCPKCNHMVSLASGCYHIRCRCGHEFCYKCGAARKDGKATCICPRWD